MTLENLITDKNKELFERVNDAYPVQLVKTNDNSWGSNIENGNAIINYCDTKYPESCFVHELLHIDTQLKGYKRLRIGISAFDQTVFFKDLMSHIDNELQHHKMFAEFEKLQYPKEQFYIDTDISTESKLRSYGAKKVVDFRPTFLHYITLIAPGGSMSNSTKSELKEIFKSFNNNSFRKYFDHIDTQFEKWTNSSSYNAEPYLKEMFITIQNGEFTWFGYGNEEEFPENGFFVDKEFGVRQK